MAPSHIPRRASTSPYCPTTRTTLSKKTILSNSRKPSLRLRIHHPPKTSRLCRPIEPSSPPKTTGGRSTSASSGARRARRPRDAARTRRAKASSMCCSSGRCSWSCWGGCSSSASPTSLLACTYTYTSTGSHGEAHGRDYGSGCRMRDPTKSGLRAQRSSTHIWATSRGRRRPTMPITTARRLQEYTSRWSNCGKRPKQKRRAGQDQKPHKANTRLSRTFVRS